MFDTPPQLSIDEQALMGWLQSAAAEGLNMLRKEPVWGGIQTCIDYVSGMQQPVRSTALSRLTDNRLRKIVREIVSSMTDIRPIWDYQTYNVQYAEQAEILNKLVRNWWQNSYADRKLSDVLMYSAVGGTGYLKVEWDPNQPGGGNINLLAMDPRDVIPFRPALSSSVQDWQGCFIRKVVSINALMDRYPEKKYMLGASNGSWFEPKHRPIANSIVNKLNLQILSPTLAKLFGSSTNVGGATDVDLIYFYVKDPTMNVGSAPRLMGRPGTNWCYTVYPLGSTHPVTGQVITPEEAKLYPRGRLIICTTSCILEDLPNPYWHGYFPLIKFTLDQDPWSILGSSVVGDLIPMQDSLNEGLRGVEDGMRQWIRRSVVADRNSIARSTLNNIDPRRAGMKVLVNPTAGEGFKLVDGPQFPTWMMNYIQFVRQELDDNSGVMGLRELAQMKQMPSADTLEKYMDSQSPLIRLRAAAMEQSLAELAEQVKVLIFQYYDIGRRVQIIGPTGATTEDFFDYDPNTMIPSLMPGDEYYRADYDYRLTRLERGTKHHRNFVFTVQRNTFLATTHMQYKMFMLQLFRMGVIDPWTALESFDVPNLGPLPEGSVFDRLQLAKQLGLIPGAQPPPGGPGGPPQAGRPPSGQQPPQMVTRKDDAGAPRPVVSESGR